jgi:tRNA dimethylallyltransferase
VKRRAPVYICGPTASGKSALALELARRLGGEIISVDSMQVYSGMDIGTAKPTAAERALIPHHLIDVADLSEHFDAAAFIRHANAALGQIETPIFCGGTGLYYNALLHGLGDAPVSDPALRLELEAAELPKLLEELRANDPVTYETIDRQNPRRVIRAVEVIRLTGKPFSAQRADWKTAAASEPPANFIGLELNRDHLHARINQRVDAMIARGLVEETRALLSRGLRENRTACQALGYRQTIDHLDGKISLPETIDLIKLRTRQFAKRQLTWFRRQLPCQWLAMDTLTTAQAAVRVMALLKD